MSRRRSEVTGVSNGGKFWSCLPAVLYAGVIFCLSAAPGRYVPQLFDGADKLFHFLEYFPFGFLVLRAVVKGGGRRGDSALRTALIVAALYALSDELHQLFVPGRYFSFIDVLCDTSGAAAGGLFYPWRK